MKLEEAARAILEGQTIADKLFPIKQTPEQYSVSYEIPKAPGRLKNISFSNKQLKFPKKPSLHLPEKRAFALHFFANHELMAIELMACALLIFPTKTSDDQKLKEGLIRTIHDEQKHFSLYLKRMKELGVEFGDYPLGDFFWRQIEHIKTPEQFYAVVGLTFEQANLDFAKYYGEIFNAVEDYESEKIMKIIYEDEIQHVAIGLYWLNKWKKGKTMWNYYCDVLPENITPARGKGIIFDIDGRKSAGLDNDFITSMKNYQGEFNITKRKQW